MCPFGGPGAPRSRGQALAVGLASAEPRGPRGCLAELVLAAPGELPPFGTELSSFSRLTVKAPA